MNRIIPSVKPQAVAPRPVLIGFAWGAMLLMSRLPQITLKEAFAIDTSYAWLYLDAALALLLITFFWPALQPLRGYLFLMAVIAVVSGPCDAFMRNSTLWSSWFGAERGWVIRFFGERLPLLIEALILLLILVGMDMKRQDFFLAVGDLLAPAVGLRLPGIGNRWLLIGLLLAWLLGVLFFFGIAAQLGLPLSALPQVLPWLPAVLLFASMNAFGEEVLYRAAPLAQLWLIVGKNQAIWLTALWFGLGHYYGGIPSGAMGALVTGLIAVLFGKAMLETHGIVLPTLMHMLGDLVIYLFVALAAAGK
jgi:membrane protease YdiL (CAAX protease family)